MKAIYYLAPSLTSTHHIADELHKVGVKDWFIHIISNDESGIKKQRLHSSNYLETLDLVRGGAIGGLVGLGISAITVAALILLQPFTPALPGVVYFFILATLTLFGLWEGGLAGIANKNRKLAQFEKEIAAGKYLLLIYSSRKNEARIQRVISDKYPEAILAAKDKHFLNPFSSLERA